MNANTTCERVRLVLMAAFDGEAPVQDPGEDARRHLAGCASCDTWWRDLQSMHGRFQGISYSSAHLDLWTGVEGRIRQPDARGRLQRQVWVIVAVVVGWRALQLVIDLPFSVFHPFVPLAAVTAALWLCARDPFAIETFAPELQKRGL